jgi:hypothetical protein
MISPCLSEELIIAVRIKQKKTMTLKLLTKIRRLENKNNTTQ